MSIKLEFQTVNGKLDDFILAMNLGVDTCVRLLVKDLFQRVTDNNPVWTGRSRIGWDVTTTAPSTYNPPATRVPGHYGGRVNLPDWQSIDARHGPVFITNNVEYVFSLEFQGPFGGVRPPALMMTRAVNATMAMVDQIIASAATETR